LLGDGFDLGRTLAGRRLASRASAACSWLLAAWWRAATSFSRSTRTHGAPLAT
jgi:hypothetical protein